MQKKLYRSRNNRWLAGICGGMGEYFGIDPNIFCVLVIFIPGVNLLAYLILAIIIPIEP
ncbi:MAG: PspC domain-containing protein [Oscillospiraceae bacterium]|nr:PspC domain-containing protein [Oscillospiraceae bacterium]